MTRISNNNKRQCENCKLGGKFNKETCSEYPSDKADTCRRNGYANYVPKEEEKSEQNDKHERLV